MRYRVSLRTDVGLEKTMDLENNFQRGTIPRLGQRVLQNPRQVLDQSRPAKVENGAHELGNRCELPRAMAVSPVVGRLTTEGASGTNDPGVCRRAGCRGVGIPSANNRRGAAQLQRQASAEGMAVRLYVENPNQSASGASVPGTDRIDLAERDELSGPHDDMAILER